MTDKVTVKPSATDLQNKFRDIENEFGEFLSMAHEFVSVSEPVTGMPFVGLFTIFLLACFVGYYVVWNVTPALHSPLMSVTNAISSVIIVGAIVAAGPANNLGDYSLSSWFGFAAVILASVNIFGGFIVTRRMLAMFKKKPSPQSSPKPSPESDGDDIIGGEKSFIEKYKDILLNKLPGKLSAKGEAS